MGATLLLSMFFSMCETTFFTLSPAERRRMKHGNRFQRLAVRLAENSEAILPAILFWNLSVNLLTFALSTILSLQLQKANHPTQAGLAAVTVLVIVVVFCEILPKNLGVLFPRFFAILLAPPLSFAVRLAKPILPFLNGVNILTRRLFFPNFQPEPFLQISDLEKLVELSQKDATLLKREQRVLQSIVHLSEVTAEELMRPRKMLKLYKPPLTFAALLKEPPAGDYIFITEPDTDEIAAAVSLRHYKIPPDTADQDTAVWEANTVPVVYVPWSMKLAGVLEVLQKQHRDIAAVLNEYGETVGVISIQDLTYFLFAMVPSRTRLLLKRSSLRKTGPGHWQVSGITNLRRLKRYFALASLPPCDALTVAGVLQEELQRMPETGDVCCWGPFQMTVLDQSQEEGMKVDIQLKKEVRA
jgi:CBS domain containing-hemolysin-like protein